MRWRVRFICCGREWSPVESLYATWDEANQQRKWWNESAVGPMAGHERVAIVEAGADGGERRGG